MADQLYLSYWLRNHRADNMLRRFGTLLRGFPYSALTKTASTISVGAVSPSEPLLFERGYPHPVPVDDILSALNEYQEEDNAYFLDTWWDLWQYEKDWHLQPARVTLCCFAPGYETGDGEHLRLDLGLDTHFLPVPEMPESARIIEKNVASLLRLVHEMDNALPVDRRQLWTESGENFADRLKETLEELEE